MILLTHSGRHVDLLHPQAGSIDLADIAIALSRIPRFNGHTRTVWSVASHSLLVAELLNRQLAPGAPPALQMAALLHDAHEAYTGDVARPVQQAINIGTIPPLLIIQDLLDQVIARAFGIDPELFQHEAVVAADELALAIEARMLMHPDACTWPGLRPMPDPPVPIYFRTAAEAELDFLHNANLLLEATRPTPEGHPA